jgi:hypothetical protein
MPVRKFRNVEEMSRLIWRPVGSSDLVRAIAATWAFGRRVNPSTLPPGVRRFRSIAEMKSARADARRPKAAEEAERLN